MKVMTSSQKKPKKVNNNTLVKLWTRLSTLNCSSFSLENSLPLCLKLSISQSQSTKKQTLQSFTQDCLVSKHLFCNHMQLIWQNWSPKHWMNQITLVIFTKTLHQLSDVCCHLKLIERNWQFNPLKSWLLILRWTALLTFCLLSKLWTILSMLLAKMLSLKLSWKNFTMNSQGNLKLAEALSSFKTA